METEIWTSFQASRGANATLLLAVVVAIWVAARFCSVMVEKEAPVSGKVICSVFSLSVFAMNWTILTNIANQWIIHTNAQHRQEMKPVQSQKVLLLSMAAIF